MMTAVILSIFLGLRHIGHYTFRRILLVTFLLNVHKLFYNFVTFLRFVHKFTYVPTDTL